MMIGSLVLAWAAATPAAAAMSAQHAHMDDSDTQPMLDCEQRGLGQCYSRSLIMQYVMLV